MKVIFIGGLFPVDRREEFIQKSKSTIQFAADNFQWTFIKGLDIFFDDLNIFTAPLLGNFPRTYKKIFTKKSIFSHSGNSKDYCIGYLQIPFLSLLSKSINIYRSLLKNAHSLNPYILVYCVHTPYLLAAVRFKKKFPESRICLIVPDLPQFMSSNSGYLYKVLKNLDLYIIQELVESVDSFVFITDEMISQFKVGLRPWVRIEGMYDPQLIEDESHVVKNSDRFILYTGTLDSRYGILDLIEAFKIIPNQNYYLWICGDGNMKKIITDYSLRDRRVKYFGQLSHKEILNLQQNASVLVNPRTSVGEYTKYSFPIKTLEYLASGKPCIMHHLPGIPKDYLEHIFIPEFETPFSLSQKILEVCEMDEQFLHEHCAKSKEFIVSRKNPRNQILKLASIINGK
jgi:glycosyltransferase involved in cell wall biosynthesis